MDISEAERPVLLFANALGDHIINLPAIRGLADLFDGRLTIVVSNPIARVLLSNLSLRQIIAVPTTTNGKTREFDPLFAAKSIGATDLLLSLNPWHSASVNSLLKLLEPKHSVGFFADFDVQLPLDYSIHSSDLAFNLVRYFDKLRVPEGYLDPLPLAPENLGFGSSLREKIGPDRLLVVVHAETKAEKSWRSWNMAQAILEIAAANHDVVVVAIAHRELAIDTIPELITAIGLPVESAMSLICVADAFLGVDSFPLHVADFARVPGVALFGPTNPSEFGFRFSRLRHHLTGVPDLSNISVRAVVDSMNDLLGQVRVSSF